MIILVGGNTMNFFSNLKVAKKLLLSYMIIALIAGAMGGYAIMQLQNLEKQDTELYEHMTVPLAKMALISTEFQKSRSDVRDMITAESPEDIQAKIDSIYERRQTIDELATIFEETIVSDEMHGMMDDLTAARVAYRTAMDKVIALAKVNNDEAAMAIMAPTGEAGIAAKMEGDAIDLIIDEKVIDAEEKALENADIADSTTNIMLIVIAVVMVIAIAFGIFISGLITRPLKKVVYMLEEMSKGHLKERLHLESKDEIGQMGRVMDQFAEELQVNAIGVMNKISMGDVSAEIQIKDAQDEISPALIKTVGTVRNINEEVQVLIKAIKEGKLDTRGNSDTYAGTWKELVDGINDLIDAFVAPINVTGEYVERISRGNIPEIITDTYNGDFNEIKNSINLLIGNLNEFIGDMKNMSEQHDLGDIDVNVDEDKFEGAYKVMAKGVNDMVFGHISVKKKAMGCVAEFAKGNFDAELERFPGKKVFINEGIEELRRNLKTFISEMQNMSEQHDLGDIDVMVDEDKFEGSYKVMAKGVNDMVNGHINVKKKAMGCVAEFVKGNFDAELERFPGKKVFINNNMEALRKNLKDVNSEIGGLVNAAIEGNLNTRAKTDGFEGDWSKLVSGLNSLIEAIVEPIKEVTSVMNDISRGNLGVTISGYYQGEFAVLSEAVNKTAKDLNQVVGEISNVLGQVSDGNLDIDHVREYDGDFKNISDSLNMIIEALNNVLGEIVMSSEQVSSGSGQVSGGSQALSQGATEQASAIQELTASIAEVAQNTKENAKNASQASSLTLSVKDNAETGNGHMIEMLEAMEEINDSSANISKIIKVIDDIAFQTNILALNAAVEAARAGQHGKGFAVVAEEVRNLAARSANAANETTDLIQGSMKKAEKGTGIAKETAKALTDIVEGVAKAADLVEEIAKSSNEQANGITQINVGVSQISQVVQTNAATAEESAAASEELSSQAELLKQMVGNFKLRKAQKGLGHGEPRLIESKEKIEKPTQKIVLGENENDKY